MPNLLLASEIAIVAFQLVATVMVMQWMVQSWLAALALLG